MMEMISSLSLDLDYFLNSLYFSKAIDSLYTFCVVAVNSFVARMFHQPQGNRFIGDERIQFPIIQQINGPITLCITQGISSHLMCVFTQKSSKRCNDHLLLFDRISCDTFNTCAL